MREDDGSCTLPGMKCVLVFANRRGALTIDDSNLPEVKFPNDGEWTARMEDGSVKPVEVKDGHAVIKKAPAKKAPASK